MLHREPETERGVESRRVRAGERDPAREILSGSLSGSDSLRLSLALSGSLWLSLALSGSLWLFLALSGSLWLFEFAYKNLIRQCPVPPSTRLGGTGHWPCRIGAAADRCVRYEVCRCNSRRDCRAHGSSSNSSSPSLLNGNTIQVGAIGQSELVTSQVHVSWKTKPI